MPDPDAARDKRRFQLYLLLRLLGVASLVGGALLYRQGEPLPAGVAALAGVATLFLRPRHLFPDRRR